MKTLKISYILFLTFLLSLTFTQCESGRKLSNGMSVTGKVGEILVVCEQDIWNSGLQEALDSQLVKYILPYLPDVPTFQLTHRTPKHFTQGVRRFRNTLFLKIDPNYQGENGKIEKRLDVWAKGQVVIDITGKNYNQLLDACIKGLGKVHKEFDDVSWRRLLKNFKQSRNDNLKKAVKKNFGVEMVLPSHSKLVTKRKNFYRIEFPASSRPIEFNGPGGTENPGTIFSGIMVYQYNFIDSSQFELKNLLMARDTMLRYNVPSEVEGMYMGTQYNPIVYPEMNAIETIYKVKGIETRGMFMFKGKPKHSTGGAYWDFHFLHPTRNKIICVSGYVDAPVTTTWTHPLREVQAILRSITIAE